MVMIQMVGYRGALGFLKHDAVCICSEIPDFRAGFYLMINLFLHHHFSMFVYIFLLKIFLMVTYAYDRNVPFQPFLNVQLCEDKYIPTLSQWSPPSISRNFSSSRAETLFPLNTNFHSSLPSALAPTILFRSLWIWLLHTSCKWNQRVFLPLWLPSLI